MAVNINQQRASQWVHEYSDMLYNHTAQRVKDTQTAKDIVQETFLAAWRNIETYNGEASVKTWLFAILKNKIIDHYRKVSTRVSNDMVSIDNSASDFFDKGGAWKSGAQPQEWSEGSNSRIETKEFFSILKACRNKLKELQNTVFSLKYLDGLECEEICKELNITPTNYWVIVHRAKVQLRTCLEKNWFEK